MYEKNGILVFVCSYCLFGDKVADIAKSKKSFVNNCYYGVMTPLVDKNSMNVLPGFAGKDVYSPESFLLCGDSQLIGVGIEIEDDCASDFFGNPITSHNIGCYGGNGVEGVKAEMENIFEYSARIAGQIIKAFINLIKSEIRGMF